MAPGATWEEPDLADEADSEGDRRMGARSIRKSFWGWRLLAARLINEEKWGRAKEALEKMKELYPEYVGPDNAYVMLAAVYRRLSDPAGRAQGPRGAGGARRQRQPRLPADDGAR